MHPWRSEDNVVVCPVLSFSTFLPWEQHLSLNLELELAPNRLQSLLSPAIRPARARVTTPIHLCECSGVKLRSSCLDHKLSWYGGISPAPFLKILGKISKAWFCQADHHPHTYHGMSSKHQGSEIYLQLKHLSYRGRFPKHFVVTQRQSSMPYTCCSRELTESPATLESQSQCVKWQFFQPLFIFVLTKSPFTRPWGHRREEQIEWDVPVPSEGPTAQM